MVKNAGRAVAVVPTGAPQKRNHKQPVPQESRRAHQNEVTALATTDVYANAFQEVYGRRVDVIDKKLGLHSSLSVQPKLSTGLLTVDLSLGGALKPGFHIFLGAEASAKSTACMTTMKESLREPIPIRKYFDAEGAIDRHYTGNILGTDDWGGVFGDHGSRGWNRRPRCNYYDSNIIETVFRDMHRTASFMPNKVFREDVGEWFLVFNKTTEHRNLVKELLKREAIAAPSKSLFTATGYYWCSVGDDDSPQAAFFIDSLPALEPEQIDEEEMSDRGLGIDARYLGKYMKLVRGKLRPKGIVLLAVNQLRDRPMAGPGQPTYYEPMGNAIKFASDTRSMWTSRVPMDDFPKSKEHGGICAEPSVEFANGTDFYAFKGITNIKNKLGTPYRKTAARVWIRDGEGEPRGFDPVYDVYRFLTEVGAIEGPITETGRKRFRINLKPIADVDWSWKSFKSLIIGQFDNNRRLLHAARELGAPNFQLRDYCRKLLDAGKAEDMLSFKARQVQQKLGAGVDLESDDEEDGE